MPNYCYNSLEIEATAQQLLDDKWIVQVTNYESDASLYRFNLHKLFPEKYPEEYTEWKFQSDKHKWCWDWEVDNTFDMHWDYTWCIKNIGTKWLFDMYNHSKPDEFFNTSFETAWSPPTWLIQKFAEMSKLNLELEYEEPSNDFEWTMIWANGDFHDDQRQYQATCECDYKWEDVKYYDDPWMDMCPKCVEEYWSSCCNAPIKNGLCSDCKENNTWLIYEE